MPFPFIGEIIMRTLASCSQLTKKDILKIFEYSNDFETNSSFPSEFARGKVLGLLFLEESLRTSASLKSAMLKLGGGWIDLDLSYIKGGEEDLIDSIKAIAPLIDVLAVRAGPDINILNISEKINIPIINAMVGMEHSTYALWCAYTIWKRIGKIEHIKCGMYGLTAYSRPALAVYNAFSKLGAIFYEDSIIEKAGAPEHVIRNIIENGGSFNKAKLKDFVSIIDFLLIPD